MRLFIGIPVSGDVQSALERLLTRFRPLAQLKWSPVYNLHLTTKFIGDWPAERQAELQAALAPLAARPPFSAEVAGLGWFPNPHHPRILWAALHAPPALAQLARDTEEALTPLGIPKEDKPFTPHLTLARVPREVPLNALRQSIAELESVEFGRLSVDRFSLYLSEPGPAGSIYSSLADFPLTAA